MYAAGRAKEASDVVLETVNVLKEEDYMSQTFTNWVSGKFIFLPFSCRTLNTSTDFTQRCLAAPDIEADAALKEAKDDKVSMLYSTFSPPTPSPLLIEWARAKLTNSSWKDALTATVGVCIFLHLYVPWA